MNQLGHRQTDLVAITAVLDRLTDAWNCGDGAAYGGEFTQDATYITYVGTLYRGAAEIGDAHQALFAKFLKGTRLVSETLDVRFCGEDIAVVITRGDTHKKAPGKLRKVQTYTMARCADGRWRVTAFQNTMRKALMEAISFRLLPASVPAAQR
jgi:uncharacterized protein (TIGR02246 family)